MSSIQVAAQGERPDVERLFKKYTNRHAAVSTWSPLTSLATRASTALGVEPFEDVRGHVIASLVFAALLALPAALYSLAANSGSRVLSLEMAVLALLWGPFLWYFVIRVRRVTQMVLALHGAIDTPAGLRRLIAWERRWFSYPVVAALAVGFLGLAVLCYGVIQRTFGPAPVAGDTLVFCATLFLFIGEIFAAVVLVIAEFSVLKDQGYDLYLPNPAQSLEIRQSLRGYNQFAAQASIYMTVAILMVAVLFPRESPVLLPIVVAMLALTYSSIIIVVVAPRKLMTRIVRQYKDRELRYLQTQLNRLWAEARHEGGRDPGELDRLKSLHDALIAAPDDLLNIRGVIGTTLGSFLLPTLVATAAAVVQRFLV